MRVLQSVPLCNQVPMLCSIPAVFRLYFTVRRSPMSKRLLQVDGLAELPSVDKHTVGVLRKSCFFVGFEGWGADLPIIGFLDLGGAMGFKFGYILAFWAAYTKIANNRPWRGVLG